MNVLSVLDNQEITIRNEGGTPTYLLYNNGRAFVYQLMGSLGNFSIHFMALEFNSEECEFFNNTPCVYSNKTTHSMSSTAEIFAYLREKAGL